MSLSTRRRAIGALLTGAAAVGAGQASAQSETTDGPNYAGLKRRILESFAGLPGKQALKFWAPAANGRPEFLLRQNAAERLFVGSSIKAFCTVRAHATARQPRYTEHTDRATTAAQRQRLVRR